MDFANDKGPQFLMEKVTIPKFIMLQEKVARLY